MHGRFSRSANLRILRCVTVSVLIAGAIGLMAGVLGVRFNATPSVPTGFYRITTDDAAPYVEFCPPNSFGALSVERGYRDRTRFGCPDGGEPLVKQIIARPGELVEVSAGGISVNDSLIPNTAPQSKDSEGRSLSAWPFGTYRVGMGTVWVASSYNARSLDSRYFGPIRTADIKHRLRPLWTE